MKQDRLNAGHKGRTIMNIGSKSIDELVININFASIHKKSKPNGADVTKKRAAGIADGRKSDRFRNH